jgi:hypothetical protein
MRTGHADRGRTWLAARNYGHGLLPRIRTRRASPSQRTVAPTVLS